MPSSACVGDFARRTRAWHARLSAGFSHDAAPSAPMPFPFLREHEQKSASQECERDVVVRAARASDLVLVHPAFAYESPDPRSHTNLRGCGSTGCGTLNHSRK